MIADHLDVATEMRDALLAFMREHGTSPERIAPFSYPAEQMISPPAQSRQRIRPDAEFHVWQTERGQLLAFVSIQEAQRYLGSDVQSSELAKRTLGWVREQDPKALIKMYHQYYWAQDLC